MQRMPVAGTALVILGVFFIVIGVGMMFDVQIRPAAHHWFGPEPSQMSWGVNDGAVFIAMGIGALGLGWWCWFPDDRPRRRPRKGRSSHGSYR